MTFPDLFFRPRRTRRTHFDNESDASGFWEGCPNLAEKWQQWMPLDVNDWRGSPFVRALPAAARSGYLDLILAQWDSEDCSLSSDPLDLAEASFLTAAEWAEFGPRILRKFQPLENGRLRNQVCFEKWENARAMYYKKHKPAEEVSQARSEAGKAGNAKRWGLVANESQLRPDLSQTDRKPSQTVHIQDKDKEQRQKTLARSVPPEELAGTLPLINGTDYEVSKSQLAEWVEAFPAVNVKQQLAEMKAWLNANPTRRKTPKGMCRSIVLWLGKEQDKGGHLIPMSMPVPPKPKTQYEIDRDEQQAERRAAIMRAGVQ